MLPGLHAAMVSMLDSNHDLEADTFVFSDGLSEKDEEHLKETWSKAETNLRLLVQRYSPKALGKTLHGNSTAYGRLYLGDLLPSYERCIYLDCDVVVNTSLTSLFDFVNDNVLVAADCTGDRKTSLDKQLFIESGIGLEGSCFNSGVLALNLGSWRRCNAIEKCKETAKKFAGRFASADQSLLNITFHDEVAPFGRKYNTPLYPSTERPSPTADCIYHFVGSPKPWDLFGSRLHNSYSIWQTFWTRSAIGGRSVLPYLSFRRTSRTSLQLLRAWKQRITRR